MQNFPRGFLPDQDPLPALPARFAPWNDVAQRLPLLIVNGAIRPAVHALPAFDTAALHDEREYETAMRALSFISHAYILSGDAAQVLPAVLARPWWQVAGHLGVPPILNYNTFNLNNWYRLDAAKPVEPGNIAIAQHFLGGQDEQWFQMVHIAIEMIAARAIAVLQPLQQAVELQDAAEAEAHLMTIAGTLGDMRRTLERMPERCDPFIYYHRVRTYMFGWKDNAALPDGLIYEGVDAYGGKPVKFRGETGAQTATIYCFDAVLGVTHMRDDFRNYLIEMREYMPPAHRAFIAQLEAGPDARALAIHGPASLRAAYNEALLALQEFRIRHLEYAALYIAKHAQANALNSTEVGTGGTPFMRYLAMHRDATRRQLL